MKLNKNQKNSLSILLIWLVTLSIIVVFNFLNNFEKCNLENDYVELKILKKTDLFQLPTDTPIICQDGVNIIEYPYSKQKTIYACLNLVEGKCSGEGKTCLIQHKKKVCEKLI